MGIKIEQAPGTMNVQLRKAAWGLVVLTAILVVVSEGIHPIAAWNLAPVILSAYVLRELDQRVSDIENGKILGFLTGVCLLTSYIHVMWFFDVGEMKTGSSTSGLVFIFTPIIAVIAGVLCGALGALLGWRIERSASGSTGITR